VRLRIRLTPRAAQKKITGLDSDGTLHMRVCAPPVDNRANQEMIHVLAKALGVRRSTINMVSGKTGRNKVVEMPGMDREKLKRALN
jgi:uncharacterized protein (TIGR00251 family)